jgi:pyridoxine kinase
MSMVRILSIQSHVVFGHVGNAAVTFPLQTLGHEVWPVPTAVLSNHAGYREVGGSVLSSMQVQDLLDGLEPRGVYENCDLLLTGYLGSRAVGEVVLTALERLRTSNEHALYCCDPVIGDCDTGVYVDPDLPAFFHDKAIPAADIVTPNLSELELLSGCESGALIGALPGAVIAAARRLIERMRPGGCVLITSFEPAGMSAETTAMAVVTAQSAWRVETPRLTFTQPPHGAGDLAAALFAAWFSTTGDPRESISDCAARLHAVLRETSKRDRAELELVSAQSEIRSPSLQFVAEPIG